MISFRNEQNHIYEPESLLEIVPSDITLFKGLFDGDPSGITFSNNNEDYLLSKSTSIIKINMKNIGALVVALKRENTNIKEIIDKIKPLRNTDERVSPLEKTKKVLDIVSEYNPLFALYRGITELSEFKEMSINFPLYIDKCEEVKEENKAEEETKTEAEEKPEEIKEEPSTTDTTEEKPKKKKNPSDLWKYILGLFTQIKTEWLHFLFILIATILCGFVMSVGIYDSFASKPLAIFFFVIAFICFGLNGIINHDTSKKVIKPLGFHILTVIDLLIGLGLSIVGFNIYYSNETEIPENMPELSTLILMSIGISLALLIAGMLIGLFIAKNNRIAKKK